MSIAHHLDALAAYGAQAVRVTPVDGEPEDLLLDGGALSESFDRIGQGPLVEVLRDARVASVTLGDGDLLVELVRTDEGARLKVAWGAQGVIEQDLDLPEPVATDTGPWFRPDPAARAVDLRAALHDRRQGLFLVEEVGGQVAAYTHGLHGRGAGEARLVATIPAVDPARFGSAAFCVAHGVRWAYIAGEMAGGISSVDMVVAMARAGLLGFYGAGGLPLEEVERALARLSAEVPAGAAYGVNLLHNPAEPHVEEQTVDLLLKYGVRRASASAYMDLTPAVVRYRLHGIHAGPDGRAACPNHLFAKLSRPEVADHFLRPAPEAILRELKGRGVLTDEQIALARTVPLAEDVTVEADSGGHTDGRPLVVLLPLMMRLRDRIAVEEGYAARGLRPRIGAAGGLGTPASVWSAFATGVDYVLTGSINQATREAGTSPLVKQMLAESAFTDVTSGPAPDMFELGAEVQVLSRGTMYAQRATRLRELWRTYASIDAIPAAERTKLERQIFRRTMDDVWADTVAYWSARDATQISRAEADPKLKMALIFRWYLGLTSRWARQGAEERKLDFQVWSGPAMGAFNEWAADSALASVESRTVVGLAEALMHGAAAHARVAHARMLGVPLPAGVDAIGVLP